MPRFLHGLILSSILLGFTQHKPLPAEVKSQGHSVLHILTANDDGEVVAETVTSPFFAFKVEAGTLDGAGVLECEQTTETRKKLDVDYPVIVLTCGSLKLILVGADLTVKN